MRRGKWTILGHVGTTALSRPLVPVEVTAIVAAQCSNKRLSCTGGAVRLIRGEHGITVRLPKGAILASSEVQPG